MLVYEVTTVLILFNLKASSSEIVVGVYTPGVRVTVVGAEPSSPKVKEPHSFDILYKSAGIQPLTSSTETTSFRGLRNVQRKSLEL